MRSLCTLFFVFLIVYVNAQQLEWSRQIGGLETDSCMFIEESGDGNYIVAGVFTDSMSVITLTCQGDLVSNGGRDIFVLKISPIGQVFWVKSFGSTEADIPVFMHIDNAGNILLYADLGDSTNFDTNGGNQLDSVPNLALVKYDNNMNYVWHKNLDEFCSVYPYGTINSDSNLNVYIGGYESSGAYVSKYDLNGNIIWNKVFESTITASVSSIDIDNHNNVYVCGTYFGELDMDPGAATVTIGTSSPQNGFFVKLDANGNYKFGNSIGSGGLNVDACTDVFVEDGLAYLLGSFQNTCNFGLGQIVAMLTADGYYDGYILCIDTFGVFQFAQSFDQPQYFMTKYSNNEFLIGTATSLIDPDNTDGIVSYLSSSGAGDQSFISRMNNSGEIVWYSFFGGDYDDGCFTAISDDHQNVYAVGYFSNTADFDGGNLTVNMTSLGDVDGYIIKLNSTLMAIKDNVSGYNALVYPNPTSEVLFIHSSLKYDSYVIVNSVGEIINTGGQKLYLDVSNFSNGSYFVQFIEGDRVIAASRFLKQ